MRTAILGWNSAAQYSGGRYHAWLLAEALAHRGHEVVYWTCALPLFARDFIDYPSHHLIEVKISPALDGNLPTGRFDVVFVIPHRHRENAFYLLAEDFARRSGARLATINFETPNWFNEHSPVILDAASWDPWKTMCRSCDMIISSTRISNEYAKTYFDNLGPRTKLRVCYPPINTRVIDCVGEVERERRILVLARFSTGDAHKGAREMNCIFCEELRGYTLVFIVGMLSERPPELQDWFREAKKFGINLEFRFKLTDDEKAVEIKRSSLVMFPSYFEGFGLPPVEAQYCNRPCIAFDLPVLREVSGDGITYTPPGDWEAFRAKAIELLRGESPGAGPNTNIASVARFERYAEEMDALLGEIVGSNHEPVWARGNAAVAGPR